MNTRPLALLSCLFITPLTLSAQVNQGYNGYIHEDKHIATKTIEDSGEIDPIYWVNEAPDGCPFAAAKDYEGVIFTGRYANYTNADTFYPSWAEDGNLYSQWTDGTINGDFTGSIGASAATGSVRIEGDDPMDLTVINLGRLNQNPAPFGGRYPCANLLYNGTWYHGSYLLENDVDPDAGDIYNWTQQEGFVGIRTASMKNWKPGANITKNDYPWNRYITDWAEPLNHFEDGSPIWTLDKNLEDGSKPIFGEVDAKAEVRFGAPHFVDFGKNMEHAPVINGQKMAYLVGHGSLQKGAFTSWIQGDAIFLARVAPHPDTINDPKSWEFFAGKDATGQDKWSKNLEELKPLIQWDSHMGNVSITYNKPLDCYLLCYSRGVKKFEYDTAILIAKELTGPYEMLHYFPRLGPVTYFGNIPSKFISEDGLSMWFCYSANFYAQHLVGNPPHSKYSMSMRELRLVKKGEKDLPAISHPQAQDLMAAEPPVIDQANLATHAGVSTSSTMAGYPKCAGITDGIADGWPRNTSHEWRSNGETKGAWVKLLWKSAVSINQLQIAQNWKRGERITKAYLEFNGEAETRIDISEQLAPEYLNKEAVTCSGSVVADINFPTRDDVMSVTLVIDEVQAGDANVNITEIRAYQRPE